MKVLGALGTGISKFLAFICALLFVVVTVAVVLAFNAERVLLQAQTYKQALLQQDLYARLPALAAAQAVMQGHYDPCRDNPAAVENPADCGNPSAQPEAGGPPAFTKNITPAQMEHILAELLPPDLLQNMVESSLDQAFAYLDSPEGSLRIKVPLVELKQRIAGDAGVEVILTLVGSLPPCSAQQLAAGAGEFAEGMPECRPPEAQLQQMKPEIHRQLQQLVKTLPDVATPGGAAGLGASAPNRNGADPRDIYRWVRLGLLFSPLISIGLLGLVTLFGVRSLKGWLRWWGWPLLIVGLLVAPLALAAVPVLNWIYLNRLVSQVPPYFSLDFVQAGFNLALEIVRAFMRPVRLQALLIGAAGLGLLLASLFAQKIERPPDA